MAQPQAAVATAPGVELFDYDMLAALADREVIYFTDYGNRWYYGIVTSPGTKLMSVYMQLSGNGVDRVLYVTNLASSGTFQFRLAQPEEYAGVEFSYGYRPRGVLVH